MIPLGIDEIVEVVGGRTESPVKPFGVARISTDTRTLGLGDLFLALSGERFDGREFVAQAFEMGACAAIVDEGRAVPEDAAHGRPIITVPDTRVALLRLAGHQRKQLAATVIAVTGSNGKTTTKCMIDHVLRARFPGRASQKSFNNDIGVPLTLLSAESADRYLVVEIGANAPGEIAGLAAVASPQIGVITSIGHAHLHGFGGLAGIAREKLSLLTCVAAGGLGVVNLDDVKAAPAGPLPEGLNVVTFGSDAQADIRVSDLMCDLEATCFKLNGRYEVRLQVPGAHNAWNAAAAFAVARRMQMDPEAIVDALADFVLPDMRLHVHRLEGITLIEDCYNANPTSMAAAIDVLKSAAGARRVMVVGEMMELGAESETLHHEAGRRAALAGCAVVIGVGAQAQAVVLGAQGADAEVEAHSFRTTQEAADAVPAFLREGDVVLVKGSRAMALERLCARIVARFGQGPSGGATRPCALEPSAASGPPG